MSYRTVVIANRCKLDLRMNYLEVRALETQKILLDEISLLIIENPAVSVTGCLLSALIAKKIKVIFCDDKRNPQFELVPYYGSHDCLRKIKVQLAWKDDIKGRVWTQIVKEKITKQADLLEELNKCEEESLLRQYIREMVYRDETNREGHAAKVYFNVLFGMDFSRREECPINAALNYGYALILSTVNREISLNGYLTQLGLFHDNVYNQFNLGSDLMEPFRVIVDRFVKQRDFHEFGTDEKHEMLEILNLEIEINHTMQTVQNGIGIYVRSVFDALCTEDENVILFYR